MGFVVGVVTLFETEREVCCIGYCTRLRMRWWEQKDFVMKHIFLVQCSTYVCSIILWSPPLSYQLYFLFKENLTFNNC